MRFGRDFEFDVVDLTLKHSMIGFVTLLVLKFPQSFVVVVYAVYVVVKCGCVDSTKTFRLGREKADLGSHLQEMEEELQVG